MKPPSILLVSLMLALFFEIKSFVNISKERKYLSVISKQLLALDFDGVICASSEESSFSSIIAAKNAWPEIFTPLNKESKNFKILQNSIKMLRPVIETGYENMLIARYLYENNVFTTGLNIKWDSSLRDHLIKQYNIPKNILVDLFAQTRDHLIENNYSEWISMNQVYDSIKLHLHTANLHERSNCYIITTKQARFVDAILSANNISPLPSDRVFDLENPFGSKPNVLKELSSRQLKQGNSDPIIHFVEDRYETLVSVAETPGLEHVRLYLVDWGYNTLDQRIAASKDPRMRLISSSEFCSHFLE